MQRDAHLRPAALIDDGRIAFRGLGGGEKCLRLQNRRWIVRKRGFARRRGFWLRFRLGLDRLPGGSRNASGRLRGAGSRRRRRHGKYGSQRGRRRGGSRRSRANRRRRSGARRRGALRPKRWRRESDEQGASQQRMPHGIVHHGSVRKCWLWPESKCFQRAAAHRPPVVNRLFGRSGFQVNSYP